MARPQLWAAARALNFVRTYEGKYIYEALRYAMNEDIYPHSDSLK